MIFLVSSGKVIFLFPKNMILFFFRQKVKDKSFSNTWKYIFCIFGKTVFLFPLYMISLFCQESTDGLFSKNVLKYDISSIIEKGDIYLRKYGISSDGEIKDDKKVYSVKYA